MLIEQSNTVKDIFKELAKRSLKFQKSGYNSLEENQSKRISSRRVKRRLRDRKIQKYLNDNKKIKIEELNQRKHQKISSRKKSQKNFGKSYSKIEFKRKNSTEFFSSMKSKSLEKNSHFEIEDSINKTPVNRNLENLFPEELIKFDVNPLQTITMKNLKLKTDKKKKKKKLKGKNNLKENKERNFESCNFIKSYAVYTKDGKLKKRRASEVFEKNFKNFVLKKKKSKIGKRISLRKKNLGGYEKGKEGITVYKQVLSSLGMERISYRRQMSQNQKITQEKLELMIRTNFPKISKEKIESIKRHIRNLEKIENGKEKKFGHSGALRNKYIIGNLGEGTEQECILVSKEDRFDTFGRRQNSKILNLSKSSLHMNRRDLEYTSLKPILSKEKKWFYRYERGQRRSYSEIFEEKKNFYRRGDLNYCSSVDFSRDNSNIDIQF